MTTTQQSSAQPLPWFRFWVVIGLLIALFSAEQNIDLIVREAMGGTSIGSFGGDLGQAPDHGPGFARVRSVDAYGPLAAAGITAGDYIRADRAFDTMARFMNVGETTGLTVDHGGIRRHVTVTAGASGVDDRQRAYPMGDIVLGLIFLSSILTGVFVLLRSGQRVSSLLLGLAFVTFGIRGSTPQLTFLNAADFPYLTFLCVTILRAMPILFLAFALRFYVETTGRRSGWARPALLLYGVSAMSAGYFYTFATVTITAYPVVGTGAQLYSVLFFMGLFATAAVFIRGMAVSDAQTRKRYALMLAAILMTMFARGIGWLSQVFAFKGNSLFQLNFHDPFDVCAAATALLGPLVFAYAVFRHRVLDLGFAVNRTLVYGVLSTVLLLAFGVIEWAAEHFIPIGMREKSLFIDAGVALGLFLTFHRLRDFIEKIVEQLFFSRWHHNEEKLRTFVRQASFIGKTEALTTAFIAELTRFSGGAKAQLFLSDCDDFKSGTDHIDSDAAAVIAMRADHAPVETAEHLDLPMIHRGDLTGFVRLGLKPSGDSYRPDEREVLAWAGHQIGLDLHALKVEGLESENGSQKIEIATLMARNADLQAVLCRGAMA